MISLAIIGILIATSVPLANTYRLKAEYLELKTTIHYLMDVMESYYLETNELFPKTLYLFYGEYNVPAGQEITIPELKYTFHSNNKHTFRFLRYKLSNSDISIIYVTAGFDFDRNGTNDVFTVNMWLQNNKPVEGSYRQIVPEM